MVDCTPFYFLAENLPMSVSPELEKIIERVRKLHAKAVSCREIGSDAEAETFAAAVQKMLALHKLSMSEIEVAAEERDEPVGEHAMTFEGGRAVQWRNIFAQAVATAHYCRVYYIPNSANIMLVGRKSDRAQAEYVFRTLLAYAERAEAASARIRGGRGHRANFMLGFATKIAERYRIEEQQFRDEIAATGTSLVRLDDAKRAVDAYMQRKHLRRASVQTRLNAGAYGAGQIAGSRANLRANGVGASSGRRALTA